MPIIQASISPLDRGFLYGDGVFETIRGEYGMPLYLSNHVARMMNAADALNISITDEIKWGFILSQLIRENNFEQKVSRIKVIVTRGVQHGLDLRETDTPTILAYVNSYTVPEKKYRNGWKLHIIRDSAAPRMAKYKTLNYLYYLYVRQQAIAEGADEALILDRNEEATETATGSLLFRTNGIWWTPDSEHQLPGIARSQVISILKEGGEDVEQRSANLEAVLSAETVWVTNSMIGVMPIVEISGYPVKEPLFDRATEIRDEFIIRGRRDPLSTTLSLIK